MQQKSLIADLILLLVALVWGTTFVIVKNATSTMPPYSFLGVRFLLGAAVLALIIAIWRRNTWKTIDRSLLLAGTLAGVWLFAGYAFQTFGLQYTTASKSGFITGLSVVLVPMFSVWILKQKPRKQTILGIIVATIGLALLSLDKAEAANLGDFLTLLCAASFGMHIITVGKYASRFDAFSFALVQITTVGILNLIGAFLFEPWQKTLSISILTDAQVFVALLVTAILATTLAFVAQSQFQKFTTASRTALIFSTEPVFAAGAAFLWAGETLSPQALIGCAGILAGMLIAELGGHDDPGPKKRAWSEA